MSRVARTHRQPVLLSDEEIESTGDAARQLRAVLDDGLAGPASVRLLMSEADECQVVLPHLAARLLAQVLTELANGNAVSIVPIHAELTTQEAADLLGVSRPSLVQLLDNGTIPHYRVGNRRRVRVRDLTEYRSARDDATRRAAAELTAESQRLHLYDD